MGARPPILLASLLGLAAAAPAGQWHPSADNPLFAPLRPGDPQATGAPQCAATDSAGRILTSYGEVDQVTALRIGGRLVRFRKAGGTQARHNFRAREGTLAIALGPLVARDEESLGYRATLTYTDRNGRAHAATVRLDCGA